MTTTSQSTAAATPDDAVEETKGERAWIPAPDNWSAYQKNNFNESRLLHLLIQRKELNSLIWDIWFPLTNRNHSMFQLPGLCCKNCYIPWLLPYLLEQSLRAKILCLGFCCQIKQFSTFRLCIFFSRHTIDTFIRIQIQVHIQTQ